MEDVLAFLSQLEIDGRKEKEKWKRNDLLYLTCKFSFDR